MLGEFLDIWRNQTSRRVRGVAYSLLLAFGISVFFNGYQAVVSNGKIARLTSEIKEKEDKLKFYDGKMKEKTYVIKDGKITKGSLDDLVDEKLALLDPRVLLGVFEPVSPDCGNPDSSLYKVKKGIGTYHAPRGHGLHLGLDVPENRGRGVCATEFGVVRFAGYYDKNLGNAVFLKHFGNTCTIYGHLLDIAVGISEGRAVEKGSTIGHVGMSGNSGESKNPKYNYYHIHLGAKFGENCEELINPKLVLIDNSGLIKKRLENFYKFNEYILNYPDYSISLASLGIKLGQKPNDISGIK